MFGKKIIAVTAMIVTVALSASMFAAYEAHIINVTAKINNALTVDTTPLEFGTVFPQEYVEKDIQISLSESFLDEGRVDDVKYVIKQKPKVRPSDQNPDGDPYATIITTEYPNGVVAHEYCLNNLPAEPNNPEDSYYTHCYPNLCPYLSKHKNENDNDMATDVCVAPYDPVTGMAGHYDCEVDAFHNSFDPANYAYGYLVKSVDDNVDNWVIDLAVPCFDGQCDQGYVEWVHGFNPTVENPFDYVLDAGMESEVFGCDLWIEVTGISLNNN